MTPVARTVVKLGLLVKYSGTNLQLFCLREQVTVLPPLPWHACTGVLAAGMEILNKQHGEPQGLQGDTQWRQTMNPGPSEGAWDPEGEPERACGEGIVLWICCMNQKARDKLIRYYRYLFKYLLFSMSSLGFAVSNDVTCVFVMSECHFKKMAWILKEYFLKYVLFYSMLNNFEKTYRTSKWQFLGCHFSSHHHQNYWWYILIMPSYFW